MSTAWYHMLATHSVTSSHACIILATRPGSWWRCMSRYNLKAHLRCCGLKFLWLQIHASPWIVSAKLAVRLCRRPLPCIHPPWEWPDDLLGSVMLQMKAVQIGAGVPAVVTAEFHSATPLPVCGHASAGHAPHLLQLAGPTMLLQQVSSAASFLKQVDLLLQREIIAVFPVVAADDAAGPVPPSAFAMTRVALEDCLALAA